MPSLLFDVIVRPERGQSVASIPESEKATLFEKPIIADKKEKTAGAVLKEAEIVETPQITLEDLSVGYQELEDRLERSLDKISKKSQGLTYLFDVLQFPDLAEAISTIFKGVSGYISFDMYRQALELDRDLAILLGEAEHGLT